jgi:DNA-binding IclR family transcriptional regulator
MIPEPRDVVLPRSREACLVALRSGKSAVTQIAMSARLSLKTASHALRDLEILGLVERSPEAVWRPTSRGLTCLVVPSSGRSRDVSREPSPNARRLLELLERPMRGRSIAKKLGISRQGARHMMHRLSAQGRVKFGDPDDPSWLVMRAEDEMPLLTREEERVLSAIPGAHSTDALQIRRRTRLAADQVETALERLVGSGFVEAVGEFNGAALFRAAAAGLAHPQRGTDSPKAEPPRPPVRSDRVRAVLSAIENAGALRIRDVRDRLRLPWKSTNGLAQYLKRKGLIRKTGELFDDPYALTVLGRFTLAEMAEPGQMKSGYPKGAVEAEEPAPPRRARPAVAPRRQKAPKPPRVKLPRLPVHSDRVQAVLSVLSSAGALRIKEVSDRLRLPHQSTNALMQYLKRKALVEKTEEQLGAPFALTAMGRATLAEIALRRAA